jgi:hypothetical protein
MQRDIFFHVLFLDFRNREDRPGGGEGEGGGGSSQKEGN